MSRRRPRRSRSRRGAGWQVAVGVTLIAVVLLVLFGGFVTFVNVRHNRLELDAGTYCPKSGPVALTVVLIDATDPFNIVQRTDLLNRIARVVRAVPRFGLLEIYTVTSIEASPPEPIFRKCNPGRAAEISRLVENPRLAERNWQTGFKKPLERVLSGVLKANVAESSPILESIQWVSVNSLAVPGRSRIPRHLIVISDLLQHTNRLSLYRSPVDFREFAKTRYYDRVRASLDGVAVELFVVRRNSRIPIRKQDLLQFWVDYFDAQGVASLRIVSIAG